MPDIDFQKIVLNLIPKKEDEPVIFYASQYETARPFIADLMWGDSEFAPGDSCWAEIDIRKVDDNLVVITDDVTIDNNEVSVVLPIQAVTCVGDNFGQVKIYADVDNLIAALNFILRVQPDPLANGVHSETAIDNLAAQIDEIAQAEGYLKSEDVAPVALSGSYNDLTDKPTIPDKLNDLSDVDADPPLANDYSLFYNYSQQKWKAMPGATYVYVNDNFYKKAQVDNIVDSMLPTIMASGHVANFSTAISDKLISCDVDNAATKITVCGKNLFSYNLPIHIGYWTSSSYVGDDSVITLDESTSWDNIRIPVNPGDTVTISGMQAQSGVYSAWLGSDDASDVVERFLNASSNSTKTVPEGAYYLALCAYNMKLNNTSYPNAQVEIGSAATTFESYSATEYDVSDKDNVQTNIGINNIFADVGYISVSCKDTIQHYIDERT